VEDLETITITIIPEYVTEAIMAYFMMQDWPLFSYFSGT